MEFSLAEELDNSLNAQEYEFNLQIDVEALEQTDVDDQLNAVIDTISNDSSAIQDQVVFDSFRSLLKFSDSDKLHPSTLSKLLDAIISGFHSEIQATDRDNDPTDHTAYRSHRTSLEIYAFLLQWFVSAVEKGNAVRAGGADGTGAGAGGKKKGKAAAPAAGAKGAAAKKKKAEFVWISNIPEALDVMVRALELLRTERIWQTTAERDTLVANCFMKPANLIAESELYMKQAEIKLGVYKIMCLAAKKHGQALNAQMTVMQNLQYTEHLSEPMAELVNKLAKEYDYSQLGEDVLREIADKQFNAQDTKGPRSFSKFLIKLAEISPRVILKQIALLQKHLDSESYPMRNAILEVIGLLIRELTLSNEAMGEGGGGGQDQDPQVQKRQIEGFFDLLFERFLDLNSYVRSKVVTVLQKTCELPTKFPKLRTKLLELAIRSLEDKSSQVRKNCIALLTKLIKTHPYGRLHGGELAMSEWTERYEAVEKKLAPLDLMSVEEAMALADARELMESDNEEGGEKDKEDVEDSEAEEEEDGEEEGEGEESDEDALPKPKPKKQKVKKEKVSKSKPRKSDGIDLAAADQSQLLASVDQDTLTRLRLTKKYYEDAIVFIQQLDRAAKVITQLVTSKVKGEVLEAMEFFKVAYTYKLESAEEGVKRMLHLIWAKDDATTEEDGKEVKGVRSCLIECYTELYFEPLPDLSPKDQVSRVAKNAIDLTSDATLAELTSLEALLGVMMSKGVISDEVITRLWQVYSTNKTIPRWQRRGAIIVLGMLAAPKPEVVADQIETLLKIGLGPLGKADLVLAKYTCIALGRISGSVKKVKGSLEDTSVRLPMDSPVFTRLQDTILHPSTSKEWFSMAEQAVNTIYGLGDQPDALCSLILRQMTSRVFTPKANPPPEDEPVEEEAAEPETPAADDEENSNQTRGRSNSQSVPQTPRQASQGPMLGNAFELSQLIFTAGHCAVKQLVHLELVERDLKRRKAEETKKAGTKAGAAAQDELDQVAGSVEDDIGDMIASTKEHELLYGENSLLGIFGPMAASIVSQPKVYRSPMLKTAATLALSKFMCVSAKFCEEHLMLLFKIFETTDVDAVKSNIVIALGDIAVCFSTIMDENSDRLYSGLHDRDPTVKKNTLMVLTHLILNGMIKVKGQLGEMAKCLEDEDKRISDLAHLFFTELSTKEKAIYNNLPDIISHLSSGSSPVTEDTFATSMKFIFTFIDKKREAEAIVEKLCQRFQVAQEPRQWRDVAYCLSLLPFNSEVAVKKLIEGLPFYQDKLHEENVFKRFQEILAKARANKAAKNDSDLLEFENILEEHRKKGTEDIEVNKAVKKTQRRKGAARAPAKARPKRRAPTSPPSSPE